MRDMNDDLIVTILVRTAIFISIWVPTTGFANRKGSASEWLCSGIFNDHDKIMNHEIVPGQLPQPYSPIFWALSVSILFLMTSVTIGRQKNSFNDGNRKILHRPKDLESMLLNFACLILLLINVGGYNVYWRG